MDFWLPSIVFATSRTSICTVQLWVNFWYEVISVGSGCFRLTMCFPASGEWRAAPCASDMAGICGTPACSHLVHVSLPEHAGDIEPPNAGSMATATTVFAPPIAFMALAPWQSATTTHSTIHFQLDFSSPVDGVAFVVVDCCCSGGMC